ncbi:hypothetical protein L5515_015556 [Caenorhabditis briggsae]|uniref:Homeobox domain-containing protein n=1 Tax=Caenorhabditis briggsae TaxID=6238 RepID=A0AAE9EC24_CAEBR|nr:hypothetical protein L5515_015556 [Caenorhabditis briggsae]
MKNFHDDIKEKNSSGKANRTAIWKHSKLTGDPSIREGTITSWKLVMQISFKKHGQERGGEAPGKKHLGNHKPKDRQDLSIFGYTQSKARPHLGGYGSLVKPPASQGDLGIHIQMEEDMEIDHEETVTIPEDCCLASSGSVRVDEGDVEEGIGEEVEENIDEKVEEEIQEEADEEIDEEVEEDPIPRKSPPTPLVLQKLQNPGTDLLSYFRHLHFPPSKPRRKCLPRRFTVAQVTILQAKFQENPYISREEKLTMAMTFGSTPLQIKRWFKNQREVQRRSFKRTFTDVKRNLLMARFQENPYPSEEDEEYLAMVTGLTKTKIRDWKWNHTVDAFNDHLCRLRYEAHRVAGESHYRLSSRDQLKFINFHRFFKISSPENLTTGVVAILMEGPEKLKFPSI